MTVPRHRLRSALPAQGLAAALCIVALTAVAAAQTGPNPFPEPIKPLPPAASKPKPAPKAAPKKPPAKATPAPAQTKAAPAPQVPDNPNADLAFGAYQQGLYRTAFNIAMKRAQELDDPKSMTLLGELYSNALGIKRDDVSAAQWYKQAADRGDREAMFALGMMKIGGRPPPVNREEGARLLASSAKLGKPAAAYNLGLLYLEGQIFPQDLKRAAELFRQAADAGNPEAQYALATFYKEGRGVEKNLTEAARLLRAAAMVDNLDAEVEYAIALFNGNGTPKDVPTALSLLNRAARQNSPIAQNRLARVLIDGLGTPVDKVEGFKWHLIAKTAGNGDPDLDAQFAQLPPIEKAKAEDLAQKWFGTKK